MDTHVVKNSRSVNPRMSLRRVLTNSEFVSNFFDSRGFDRTWGSRVAPNAPAFPIESAAPRNQRGYGESPASQGFRLNSRSRLRSRIQAVVCTVRPYEPCLTSLMLFQSGSLGQGICVPAVWLLQVCGNCPPLKGSGLTYAR